MAQANGRDELAGPVRTAQVVAGALVGGVGIFLAIALAVRTSGDMDPPATAPLVTYVAVAFAAVMLLAHGLLPARVAATGRQRIARGTWVSHPAGPAADPAPTTDAGRLVQVFFTSLIIGLSLLEGAAFFLLIAYFLEGHWLALATALLFIGRMALDFPTRGKVERWLDGQLEQLHLDRQAAGG